MEFRMYLFSAKGTKAFVWNAFSGSLDFVLFAAIRTGWFLLEAAPFRRSGNIRRSAIVVGTSTAPALPTIGSAASSRRFQQLRGDPRDKGLLAKENHRWSMEYCRCGIRSVGS